MVDLPLTPREASSWSAYFHATDTSHGRHAGCQDHVAQQGPHYRQDLASGRLSRPLAVPELGVPCCAPTRPTPARSPVKVSETIQRASSPAQALCSTGLGGGNDVSGMERLTRRRCANPDSTFRHAARPVRYRARPPSQRSDPTRQRPGTWHGRVYAC
jgi:hypothetical protein